MQKTQLIRQTPRRHRLRVAPVLELHHLREEAPVGRPDQLAVVQVAGVLPLALAWLLSLPARQLLHGWRRALPRHWRQAMRCGTGVAIATGRMFWLAAWSAI